MLSLVPERQQAVAELSDESPSQLPFLAGRAVQNLSGLVVVALPFCSSGELRLRNQSLLGVFGKFVRGKPSFAYSGC